VKKQNSLCLTFEKLLGLIDHFLSSNCHVLFRDTNACKTGLRIHLGVQSNLGRYLRARISQYGWRRTRVSFLGHSGELDPPTARSSSARRHRCGLPDKLHPLPARRHPEPHSRFLYLTGVFSPTQKGQERPIPRRTESVHLLEKRPERRCKRCRSRSPVEEGAWSRKQGRCQEQKQSRKPDKEQSWESDEKQEQRQQSSP